MKISKILVWTILLLSLLFSQYSLALAGWTTEVVDAPKYFTDFYSRAIAIDSSGNPHIAYGGDHLYHAYYDGTNWQYETVDSSNGTGRYASIAIDSMDKVHISYYDESAPFDSPLRYATNASGSWVTLTLDSSVAKYTSIGIDSMDKVHISYYDDIYDDLRYAANTSGSWVLETVDSRSGYGSGYLGLSTSIGIDSWDQVHISYFDGAYGDLKYAANIDPDLIMTAVNGPGGTYYTGDTLSFSETVKNQGSIASGAFVVRFYLSTDTTINSFDIVLTPDRSISNLNPGASSSGGTSVTIPSSVPPDTYYIGACADALGAVSESNEGNNCRASTTTIQVIPPPPDLTMTVLSGPGGSFDAGNTFSISSTAKNQGGAASGAFVIRFYLSANSTISSGDIALTPDRPVSNLNGGASSSGNTTVTIPAATPVGTYFVGACADANLAVAESDESNNCRSDATIEVVSSSALDVGITGADEKNSDVAYNPVTQEYLTVWQNSSSIMGEIRAGDGSIVKSDFIILSGRLGTGLTWTYTEPAVTYKSGSNIYMVVAKLRVGTNARIVARRLSVAGTLSTSITISPSVISADLNGRPDIAADTVGSNCCILVVWKQADSIMGQRINGDGTLARR